MRDKIEPPCTIVHGGSGNQHSRSKKSVVTAQSFQSLLAGLIERPDGIKGRGSQKFADSGVHPGDGEFTALLLGQFVAAQQERNERRAEVAHTGKIDDEIGRGILLHRVEEHLGGGLHQALGQLLDFRRRDDDRAIPVVLQLEVFVREDGFRLTHDLSLIHI